MDTRIWNFEFHAKVVPNLVNNQLCNSKRKYDADRRSYDGSRTTHDGSRTIHDGSRTTHYGSREMVFFNQVVYPKATRRPHDGYTTSYWEYDAFELNHEGLAMVRCSSFSLSCNKSSNAAAFFFRIVASSLYAMLQELKFDESFLCFKNYKFLCLSELRDTCERHE